MQYRHYHLSESESSFRKVFQSSFIINLKHFIKNCRANQEMVSQAGLCGVQKVVQFLKRNIRNREIFSTMRYDERVLMISREISRDNPGLIRILESSTIQESAAALQFFLVNLKKPLIPPRIQALALDDHPGITPETVAHDILGMLREEVHGRHAQLLSVILDLMHSVLKYATADELTGCSVPISMMPLFFNLRTEHMPRWRKVAIVFIELIRYAPQYFDIAIAENLQNNRIFDNINDNITQNQTILHQRLLEVNMVLRRYIFRADNRGDATFYEIYNHIRREPNRRRHIFTD